MYLTAEKKRKKKKRKREKEGGDKGSRPLNQSRKRDTYLHPQYVKLHSQVTQLYVSTKTDYNSDNVLRFDLCQTPAF